MSEPYDKRTYDVVLTLAELSLVEALAQAQELADEHGGVATVWRQRPMFTARVRIATFRRRSA